MSKVFENELSISGLLSYHLAQLAGKNETALCREAMYILEGNHPNSSGINEAVYFVCFEGIPGGSKMSEEYGKRSLKQKLVARIAVSGC